MSGRSLADLGLVVDVTGSAVAQPGEKLERRGLADLGLVVDVTGAAVASGVDAVGGGRGELVVVLAAGAPGGAREGVLAGGRSAAAQPLAQPEEGAGEKTRDGARLAEGSSGQTPADLGLVVAVSGAAVATSRER